MPLLLVGLAAMAVGALLLAIAAARTIAAERRAARMRRGRPR